MITQWISELIKSSEQLQKDYSLDSRTIINEHDLKYGIRQKLEVIAPNFDMLVKPEVPWYDQDCPGQRVKFYFDLAVLKKSVFELEFRNARLNNKGYYYNDDSLAIMMKFVKPNFNFAEIGEDLDKLKYFTDQTSAESDKQSPVLLIGCSDIDLYNQTSKVLSEELKRFSENLVERFIIIIFSPQKLEVLNQIGSR